MNILLIPCQQNDSIILPQSLVKYVLPYAPMLPSNKSHEIVVGSLIYENEKIPVLDLARLFAEPVERTQQAKLIIVACITEDSPVNYYAVIANYSPRMMQINKKDLEETSNPVAELLHSQVKLRDGDKEQLAFIPDMEKIEAEIFSE